MIGNGMTPPDYRGGSIVNLMSSLLSVFDADTGEYPALRLLDTQSLFRTRTIVLMVIDGLGYDYLTGPAGRGSCLRSHLRGAITSVCPPTTAAAITTFMTGLAPQQHGFTGWFVYFKELADVLAVLPFRSRHGGEALGRIGLSPRELCGLPSVFDRIRAASHLVVPEYIAFSDFNLAFRGKAGIRSYRNQEEFFRVTGECVRNGGEPTCVYAYWSEFDSICHDHGVNSRAAAGHFREFDSAFSDWLTGMREENFSLIVTADHGFVDTGPESTILIDGHPELSKSLLLPLCGEPRLAYCYVHPDSCGRFEDYLASALKEQVGVMKSSEFAARGFFGLGTPHPRLADRIGHYVLVMNENYAIKDQIMGERPFSHRGVHGGLSRSEMLVPLIVVDRASGR